MTKKDGDKLRAMQEELREIRSEYGRDSKTGIAASELIYGIEKALRGESFEVRNTDPRTGRILPRHVTEAPTARLVDAYFRDVEAHAESRMLAHRGQRVIKGR